MSDTPPQTDPRPWRMYVDLFLVGALILSLEMLLIRWMGTEIRVFAYFRNLTLMACFFGMGLGCLRAGGRDAVVWTYPGLVAFVALILLPRVSGSGLYDFVNRFLAELSDMPLWTWSQKTTTVLGAGAALALLVLLFLFLTFLFVPPGRLLGTVMNAAPNKILAYSANIAGSLVGVLAFYLVSYLSLPPWIWFVLTLTIGLPLLASARQRLLAIGSIAALAALFAIPTGGGTTVWSPYQKIVYEPLRHVTEDGDSVELGYSVLVNNAFHQKALNLAPEHLAAHPEVYPEWEDESHLGYNLVYRLQERPARVLIVGSGTGNDVAAALRNGAEHVDAVEIDPGIASIGRLVHPEHPYDDPRVTLHVEDARSFFRKADQRYDIITFGALDSHTINSSLSTLRIDNYVYTVEALRQVKSLLAPGGIVWLLHAFESRYIGERLYGIMTEAFGFPPVAFYNQDVRRVSPSGGGGTFATDLEGRLEERINANPRVSPIVERTRMSPRNEVLLATDDWPYLYVKERSVPRLYRIVMGVLVLIALALVRPFGVELRSIHAHFFFLGAAFMLVEVQSISKMALLFGNTWIVNAVVISAIMVMILIANVAALWLPERALLFAYLGLFATLALSYSFPLDTLIALSPIPRAVAASTVMGLPILFAGIVFIQTFASTPDSNVAMGSNLLGAIVGGACQSLSFVIGLNALGLIAMLFYGGSLLHVLRRRAPGAGSAPAAP